MAEDHINILKSVCNLNTWLTGKIVNDNLSLEELNSNQEMYLLEDNYEEAWTPKYNIMRLSSMIQDAELLIEAAADTETSFNNYLTSFLPYYFGLKDMEIENSSPLLLGAFTNVTAFGFISLNKALNDSATPYIIDNATYPNFGEAIKEKAHVVGGDGTKLPFADETMTSIQSDHLYSFCMNQRVSTDFADEISRVLKPGGRCIMVDIDITQLERYDPALHKDEINPYELTKLTLENSGLEIIEDDNNELDFASQVFLYKKFATAMDRLAILNAGDDHKSFLMQDLTDGNVNYRPHVKLIVARKPQI